MKFSNNYTLLYLESLALGGEKIMTDSFFLVAKKYFYHSKKIRLAAPGLLFMDSVKNLQLLLGSLAAFIFILRNYYKNKKVILYSSHSFSVLPAIILKKFGVLDAFWFHYHGTKVSHYSAYYRNPLKRYLTLWLHKFFNLIIKTTEKLAVKKADIILIPSKTSLAYESKNYVIISSYVNTTIFYPRVKTKITQKLIVGFIGRIDEEKGIFTFLDGCMRNKKTIKEVRVTVQKGYNNQLLNKILQYKDYLNIKLYFDLPRNEIAQIFGQADCIFLPSKSEHFPLVMLESLALGIPFFAPDTGNCKALLSQINSELVLKKTEPDEVAKKLAWFVQLSKQEKQTIINRCLVVAQKYSFDNFRNEVEQFLFQQIKKHR